MKSELEVTVSRGRKKIQDTDHRIRFNGIFYVIGHQDKRKKGVKGNLDVEIR